MKKIFSYITYRIRQTSEYDQAMTRSFLITSAIVSTTLALIAITGRPSGATFIHISTDFVVAFALNILLFSVTTSILAFLLSLLFIPIPRLALAAILYVGTGHGLLLYYVDAGTKFSIIIGILTSFVTVLLSFGLHMMITYRLGRKVALFIIIGVAIISVAFFMGKIDESTEPIKGPHHVQFFTYGSGKDPYRDGFGEEVTEVTETVDASHFITNWSDKRERFWNFGPENFPINGRVFMPDGDGPFPVILTVHGNHTMEKFSTDGYDYLGESLASHGFIFISVDEDFINYSNITGQPNDNYLLRTWVLLQHIVQLKEMNEDENSLFYQKIDLQEIALSGHSRGGQAAAMAADFERFIEDPELLKELQDINIKAVAAISPTDKTIDSTRPKLEDVSYFVMHGAQDADVYNFRGDHQFYRTAVGDDHLKATLYIENANHVQFNSDWGRHDLAMPKGLLLNQLNLLSKKEQQQIALTYLTAFYKEVFQEENPFRSLLEDENLREDTLPETTMIHKYIYSSYTPIVQYDEHTEILGSFDGFSEKDIVRPKNRSNGNHPKQALQLNWDNEATYEIPLHYFNNKPIGDELVISLANNMPNTDVQMTVSLETSTGQLLDESTEISPVIDINQTPFGILDDYYRDGKYTQSWEPIFETLYFPINNVVSNSLEDAVLTIHFEGENGSVLLEEIGVD